MILPKKGSGHRKKPQNTANCRRQFSQLPHILSFSKYIEPHPPAEQRPLDDFPALEYK
jgi:hypothetical protein